MRSRRVWLRRSLRRRCERACAPRLQCARGGRLCPGTAPGADGPGSGTGCDRYCHDRRCAGGRRRRAGRPRAPVRKPELPRGPAACADGGDRAGAGAPRAGARAFGTAVRPADTEVTLDYGQHITLRAVPVAAAGCYVPGGRAAYPSSLVMAAVPAQVAGVGRIVVASPPGADGLPAEVVLGTAAIVGVAEVYAVGGAAAIAALAYGTASVPPVSVITGPGSPWVQEAKRQVSGMVGIDGFAGPSEGMIVAAASADPAAIALAPPAPAEHGRASVAGRASHDAAFVDAVAAALDDEAAPIGAV